MLRLAGAAILMAFSTPAYADDWYYVSSAKDLANISFIDKDSIRETDAGTLRAAMFSVLAKPDEEGGSAFRFEIEVNCTRHQSRLVAYEIFDADRKSQGKSEMDSDWEAIEGETQGDTIATFICGKGKLGPTNLAAGSALPFDSGKAMLAALAKAKGQ